MIRYFTTLQMQQSNIYKYIQIEKVDMFRKLLNKQFIERLRAIFIVYKTQLQTPTDCFIIRGTFIQIRSP